MWTRRELKEKAKQRVKLNYWRCVLGALLLSVIGLGAGTGSTSRMYSWIQGDEKAYYEDDENYLDENEVFKLIK